MISMWRVAERNKNLDKNPNLKPSKKKWEGEINFPENDNIKNNINNLYNCDLFIWKDKKLSQDYLRTVDEDTRDEIAKDVFNFLLKYPFDQIKFPEESIRSAWKAICKFSPTINVEDGISYISNSSTSGNAIYKHFFPNIIKVKGPERPSIYDILTNKETLWHTIRNRMGNTLLYNDDREGIPVQYPMPMCLSQICIGAKNSGFASMGSIFKPSVAKAIYQKYIKDGDKVLDYSCGFGTRLLGLMSLKKKDVLYCGYEPNTETFDNLNKMINYFNFNAKIKKTGSETELFDEKFDFIFSSPSYFNVEIYSNEETQCYNKFPVYEEWLEKYWHQTVKNIKQMSKDNAIFGINIGGEANDMMKKLEKDMTDVILSEGYHLIDKWYMLTSKSHLASKKGNADKKFKLEGIHFYEKNK